jgi:hypothetical protein
MTQKTTVRIQYFVSFCQAVEEGEGVEAEAEVFMPDPFPMQGGTLQQQAKAGNHHSWVLVTKRITACTERFLHSQAQVEIVTVVTVVNMSVQQYLD